MRWLDKKTQAKRDKLIMKLNAQGLTAKQISAQVNLSPDGVRAVLNRAKERKERGYGR